MNSFKTWIRLKNKWVDSTKEWTHIKYDFMQKKHITLAPLTSAAAASAIAVSTGTQRSAAAASAVKRLADVAVATVSSAATASAIAAVVTPNVE
jgi:hypothetical protein